MTTELLLLKAWNWRPTLFVVCAVMTAIYLVAWRKAPRREMDHKAKYLPRSWALLLALGIFVFTVASPLDALAEGYLFSAHMLQHLLLLLVVPPLLLLALPVDSAPVNLPATETGTSPGRWDRRSGTACRTWSKPFGFLVPPLNRLRGIRPGLSWLAGVGAMWLWHVPALCNAAVSVRAVRSVQTVSLLVLGTLFWLPILGPRTRERLAPLAGIVYLFSACFACTILGVIITFIPVNVCSVYIHPADPLGVLPLIREGWGLTPGVDQQVGGLLMWVPACLIYLCGIMALLARWYSGAEPNSRRVPGAANQPAQS